MGCNCGKFKYTYMSVKSFNISNVPSNHNLVLNCSYSCPCDPYADHCGFTQQCTAFLLYVYLKSCFLIPKTQAPTDTISHFVFSVVIFRTHQYRVPSVKQCSAVWCRAVAWHEEWHTAMQYSAVQCSVVKCSTAWCETVPCRVEACCGTGDEVWCSAAWWRMG